MCDESSTGTGSGPSDAPDPSLPGPRESSLSPFGSFEYLPDERAYRASFDADEVTPSIAVVEAVSAVADADPTDLPALHSVVDPDALDAVVGDDGPVLVTFEFADHGVTLRPGRVEVQPPRPDGG